MKNEDKSRPVEVFNGTYNEASIVKTLLEDAGILAFLKDEYRGVLAPWHVAGGGAGAVKVVVSEKNEETAKLIVEEFEKNIKS